MVLAKADSRIAAKYDTELVPKELQTFGSSLRHLLAETIDRVLNVTGEKRLLDNDMVRMHSHYIYICDVVITQKILVRLCNERWIVVVSG
jgi:phosphoenolpyruvate carboxylase